MTNELSEKILEHLSKCDKVNSLDLANIFQEDHQKVIGAIKSLQTIGNVSLLKSYHSNINSFKPNLEKY